MVFVIDGVCGFYIGLRGEVFFILFVFCVLVDICGVGDVYVVGIFYGLFWGMLDVRGMGDLVVCVVVVVVG